MPKKDHEKEVVFFIDKEKFKTAITEFSVRDILEKFAQENPEETTLVHRKGNELDKLTDLNFIVNLVNGMRFVVYHNGPTPVS